MYISLNYVERFLFFSENAYENVFCQMFKFLYKPKVWTNDLTCSPFLVFIICARILMLIPHQKFRDDVMINWNCCSLNCKLWSKLYFSNESDDFYYLLLVSWDPGTHTLWNKVNFWHCCSRKMPVIRYKSPSCSKVRGYSISSLIPMIHVGDDGYELNSYLYHQNK